MSGKIAAIDFGTSNSSIGIIEAGKAVLIPNREGKTSTPTAISFLADGSYVVGQAALERYASDPLATITGIKKLLGKRYSQIDPAAYAFDLEPGPNDTVQLSIHNERFLPQEIAALILRELVQQAETYCEMTIEQVVLTVPVKFDPHQLGALAEAAAIAQLRVLRYVRESTAVSFYYNHLQAYNDQVVLFFDLGGGSLDLSILNIDDGVLETKSTIGDFNLGGRDFNQLLTDYLVQYFARHDQVDFSHDRIARYRLEKAAELAKIFLSYNEKTRVSLPFIAYRGVIRDLEMTLSREEVNQLFSPLVDKAVGYIDRCIANGFYQKGDIDEVVLIGAATEMPLLKERIQAYFGTRKIVRRRDADVTVCLGAAFQAGILEGTIRDNLLLDTLPFSLELVLDGKSRMTLLPKEAFIPLKEQKTIRAKGKTTTKKEIALTLLHVWNEQEHIELEQFRIPFCREFRVLIDVDSNGHITVDIIDVVQKRKLYSRSLSSRGSLSSSQLSQLQLRYSKYRRRQEAAFRENSIDMQARQTLQHTEQQLASYGHAISAAHRSAILSLKNDIENALQQKLLQRVTALLQALAEQWQLVAYQLHRDPPPAAMAKPAKSTILATVREHIARGELQEATGLLLQHFDTDRFREILLLSFRLNTLQRDQARGTVSFEHYQVHRNQVAYATLDLVRILEKEG